MGETDELINKMLAPYQEQLDEINNDLTLKRYIIQKDDDPIITLMFYVHLIEIMEKGPHSFLIEEALRRKMLEEKNVEQLTFVASLLRPHIDGKPTIAKIVRWELIKISEFNDLFYT